MAIQVFQITIVIPGSYFNFFNIKKYDDGTVKIAGGGFSGMPTTFLADPAFVDKPTLSDNTFNNKFCLYEFQRQAAQNLTDGLEIEFSGSYIVGKLTIPPGNYPIGGSGWLPTTIFYSGAPNPYSWGPATHVVWNLSDAIGCEFLYSPGIVIGLTDQWGYTDITEITGIPSEGAYNGNFPPTGSVLCVPQNYTGFYVQGFIRAAEGGYLRPGQYQLQANQWGEWQGCVDFVCGNEITMVKNPLDVWIVKQYGLRSVPPELRLVSVLPAPLCPVSYPPVVKPPEELVPVPETAPVPVPIPIPPAIPPAPVTFTPSGDLCCDNIVGQLSSIAGQMKYQTEEQTRIGGKLNEGLNQIALELRELVKIFGNDGVVVDEEIKNILRDIAKSLIVGYDDPEGIKERVADICASFLNLIDSRRG